MKPRGIVISFILLVACNVVSSRSFAQLIHILSPIDKEEICLGTTEPIAVSISNPDTVSRTLFVSVTIRTIAVGAAQYFQTITLPDVPAGATIDTILPAYVTNPNKLSQLGSFTACAQVSALDPSGNIIINWPFADSVCNRIFGIRTMATPFNEPFDTYSKIAEGETPSRTQWVSFGATVVEGDSETWDPPPPRYRNGNGVGIDTLLSPVVRLDRSDITGNRYVGAGVGDTLISFPFNLNGQTKVVVSFDFMRGGKRQYPALWDQTMMTGPEQSVRNSKGDVIRVGDSLILEFKDPLDQECTPNHWNRIAGIDGGVDLEFKSCWLIVFDTMVICRIKGQKETRIMLDKDYLNSSFRFRLRLQANNNSVSSISRDDDDTWYIDNIETFIPRNPELEVMWTRVVTPYATIPFSQASALPVYVSVKNQYYTAFNPHLPITTRIEDETGKLFYLETDTIYWLPAGVDTVIRMPDWNAQAAYWFSDRTKYIVSSSIPAGYDYYSNNDETHSFFYLNANTNPGTPEEFALDGPKIQNDIPIITNKSGSGIGFDSSGSYAIKFTLTATDTLYGARIYFGSENQSNDPIRISIHHGDSNSCVPEEIVTSGNPIEITTVRNGDLFDKYWTYYFDRPYVLPAGIYWCAVSQLTTDNFAMGATLYRGGGSITVADSLSPVIEPIYRSTYGTQWSPTDNSGDVSCAVAVETIAGSGNWTPLMPQTGWWPANTSGNSHQAFSWDPQITNPYIGGGSFLPMIRVMVGGPPWQVGVKQVGNDKGDVSFESISPNPFLSGETSAEISFTINRRDNVLLEIYDINGGHIKTLVTGMLEEGLHTTYWNGRNSNGKLVPGGIYFCRLHTNGRIVVTKIIVVR